MINEKIINGIERKFSQKDCTDKPFTIVLWQSSKDGLAFDLQEYEQTFLKMGIILLKLSDKGPLWIKNEILVNPDNKYLIYVDDKPLSDYKNPIIDLELAYPVFSADQWSMYLDEVGLGGRPDLLDFIKSYSKFFSKEKMRKGLAKFIKKPQEETGKSLELKLLASYVSIEDYSINSILIKILTLCDPDEDSQLDLISINLNSVFWENIEKSFEYKDSNPTLPKFVRWLLINDLSLKFSLNNSSLAALIYGDSSAAYRFCEIWRNSVTGRPSYIIWSKWLLSVENEQLRKLFVSAKLDEIVEIKTFFIEEYILSTLTTQLCNTDLQQNSGFLKKVIDIAMYRKGLDFWHNAEDSFIFKSAYSACYSAALFFDCISRFSFNGITTDSNFVNAYVNQWYKVDFHYRLFFEAMVELKVVEIFKDLSIIIQNNYRNKFLNPLSNTWIPLITENGNFYGWKNLQILRQIDFYKTIIEQPYKTASIKRNYVIISDGLRYEVAKEFIDNFQETDKFQVSIKPMISGLPSITKLGMAALLPHKSITMKDPDTLLVDGKSSQGIESRRKILSDYNGTAIDADLLLSMKKEEARDFQKEYTTIYIYHNKIDSTGDNGNSEDAAFTACREAQKELERIVKYVQNYLNGSQIFITSDHGFIYTIDKIPESQRSLIPGVLQNGTISKKRYKIGLDFPHYENVLKGNLQDYGIHNSSIQFLIPYGIQLFHFVGGAKFFHGGAMPQEVIIPLISITKNKSSSANVQVRKKVEVCVVTVPSIITTRVFTVRIFQTDSVSDTVLPRTIKAGIYDGTKAVSDEPTILLNTVSNNSNDLTKLLKFHLVGESFSTTKNYIFVIKDNDTDVTIFEHSLQISLLFMDEF